MAIRPALAATLFTFLCATAVADVLNYGPPGMPTAAQAAALAAEGVKPGDDQMTCPQIGAEMKPFVSQIESMSLAMAADAEALQKSQKQAKRPPPVNMALGLAGNFIPGMGLLTQGALLAQQAQMQRAAAAAGPLRDKMMSDASAMMEQAGPLLRDARFNRLMQLAEAKCQSAP